MKKLYIVISLIGILNAQEKNKSVYPDAIVSTINFEIRNKSTSPIGISVNSLNKNSDYYLLDAKLENMQTNPAKIGGDWVTIPAGSTFATSIDLNSATMIRIARRMGQVPSSIETYSVNASGKTRFLSYNTDKKDGERLYPQTGPLKGLGKYTPNFIMEDRTETGLLKRNNVVSKDIMLKK